MSSQTVIPGANGGSAAARRRPVRARERLLRAALVRFEADGTLGPSLEDIRRDAGVSVGALYHHFPDKQALAGALYVELMEGFQEGFLKELRSRAGAQEGVKAGVHYYLRWVSSNRAAASFVLAGRPQDPRLRERNRRFLADVMAWWQTHAHYGAVRALPLDVIHALWLGPAQEYSRQWVAGRAKRVPSSVAQLLADAAWQTLKEQT